MYVLSEALLYICFCLLVGGSLINLIPVSKKPAVSIPHNVFTVAILGVVVLSFIQIIKLIIFFKVNLNYEVGFITFRVIRDYNIGNAWFLTLLLAIVLLYLHGLRINSPIYAIKWQGIFILSLLQVVAFGWASHSTTVYEWSGFGAQTLHFLAITIWTGVMLIVGWFGKDNSNWCTFVRWFSPLSICSVIVSITAGLILMSMLAPQYINSWMSSYGQALLIKHLSIIPLLGIAFINGFILKRWILKDAQYSPLKWLRAESIIVASIFIITAYMGQQAPPHDDLKAFLEEEVPSPMFLWLTQFDLSKGTDLHVTFNPLSACLLGFSIIAFLTGLFLTLKKRSFLFAFGSGMLFVGSAYLSLMLAIQ